MSIKHVDLDTLSNVISAIPSNIFFKNTDLKYVFSSHIWEQVDNGGSDDFDIYGKSDRDIRKDAVNLDNLEAADRKIIETGKGTRYTIRSEVDGHLQYLELVKEPVYDKDGNIIGIVGLINDVTTVTKEMSDMLENEKAYRDAMRAGSQLSYEVNLTKDELENDMMQKVNGREINLLDSLGMKAPCSYSEMMSNYVNRFLVGDNKEFLEYHNVDRLLELFNNGKRHLIKEFHHHINGTQGEAIEAWALETILLMKNTKDEIVAFITINDVTEKRKNEEAIKLQLEENVREAERIANMKSDFLANMSHEIRTPMNAVIGMAELALREDIPESARDYINQIRNSGKALLNIINDILDFSKIESGKMDIIPEQFDSLSAMHDVSGILINRVGDKDLELVATINPFLPIGLYGDCLRIKQVLINLANNAIKFTQSGYVKIDVDFDKLGDDEIMLKIAVEDTGIGIKEEDLEKIFVSFQQVDSKRNRNIEGTGLGLAICEKLLELMGGRISVSSDYGKGSVFSFKVPLKVTDWTPSLTVTDKTDVAISGCWNREIINETLLKIFNDLDVENVVFSCCDDVDDTFFEEHKNKKLHFLMDYDTYKNSMLDFADKHPDIKFTIVSDMGITEDNLPANVFLAKKPLSTIGVCMTLNNVVFHSMDEATVFDFVAPEAKILIVDDNEINLSVAEGILEPLNMQITTAISGKKALKLLETNTYDIIFMDHMMPELDGVETTRIIRIDHPEMADIPIIALTANVVGNAKEMFLSEGMNGYVAKPIELKTITNTIRQWLPKEKIRKCDDTKTDTANNTAEEKITIADLDVDTAISMLGNKKIYFTVLEKYTRNIKAKAEQIKAFETNEDIRAYTIEVHSLKSLSKQIGAMELSEMAAELEACGNANNIETIHDKTDAMLEKFVGYYDKLISLFDAEEASGEKDISQEVLLEWLNKMLEAADELDLGTMESIVEELSMYHFEGLSKDYFMDLKEASSNIDVEGIAEIIENWKKEL